MSRVNHSVQSHARHAKVIKKAKGYYGRRKSCFRTAVQAVEKAGQYAYIGRKQKKRNFRRLWITRINAAARMHGMTYSRFMNGIKLAEIDLDRKVLADIAARDEATFAAIAKQVATAIAKADKKAA